MQEKLYKISTAVLGIILLVDIGGIIWMFINREIWVDKFGFGGVMLFSFIILAIIFIYSYFDLNIDKIIVNKYVRNGDIALARITRGSFKRVIRTANMKTKVLWELDLQITDQDMNTFATKAVEKFNTSQKEIPNGYVYVTYNPKKPKNILIIPNILIQSIPEYAPLVQEYEQKIKPTYINAYYNKGLELKTFKQILNEQKAHK